MMRGSTLFLSISLIITSMLLTGQWQASHPCPLLGKTGRCPQYSVIFAWLHLPSLRVRARGGGHRCCVIVGLPHWIISRLAIKSGVFLFLWAHLCPHLHGLTMTYFLEKWPGAASVCGQTFTARRLALGASESCYKPWVANPR